MKNISYMKKKQRYKVTFVRKGILYYLGLFKTLEEAIKIRDQGNFTRVNRRCSSCGKETGSPRTNRIYCRSCLQLRQKVVKVTYARRIRKEMLDAYGHECICCGEKTPEFLTLDHIYNDGAEERKKLRGNRFYSFLRRNGYPKDRYQLLCWNCQEAKAHYGQCPHLRNKHENTI